ncbi:hypothetical protein DL93DRAFT_2156732 [Clavulina sp. PMI_390]|nr:hypothetical protein DL93DRAFT_2156732 [Clavulina sp. PMI_390]
MTTSLVDVSVTWTTPVDKSHSILYLTGSPNIAKSPRLGYPSVNKKIYGDIDDMHHLSHPTPMSSPVFSEVAAESDFDTNSIPPWAFSNTSRSSAFFEVEQLCDWEIARDLEEAFHTSTSSKRSSTSSSSDGSGTDSRDCCKFLATNVRDLYSLPNTVLATEDLEALCDAEPSFSTGKLEHSYDVHSCAPPPDDVFLRDLYYSLKELELNEKASKVERTFTPPPSPMLEVDPRENQAKPAAVPLNELDLWMAINVARLQQKQAERKRLRAALFSPRTLLPVPRPQREVPISPVSRRDFVAVVAVGLMVAPPPALAPFLQHATLSLPRVPFVKKNNAL